MSTVVKWAVILAAVIAVMNVLFLVAGLHKNPMMGLVFVALAIVVNLAAVFLALRETAADSPYGRQLLHGALIGLVAGVLIFAVSWTLQTMVFPDSMEETRQGQAALLEAAPIPESDRQAQLAAIESQTVVSGALSGMIGTLFTSILGAAVMGAFLRRK